MENRKDFESGSGKCEKALSYLCIDNIDMTTCGCAKWNRSAIMF